MGESLKKLKNILSNKKKYSVAERLELAKKCVFEVIDILDNEVLADKQDSWNKKYYIDLFKSKTQFDLVKFFKAGELRYYIDDNKNDISLEKAIKLCDELGVPAMEDITLPFLYKDKYSGEELYASKKCLCIHIKTKRLHQISSNENHSSSDIGERDWKTNQAIGDSKSAMVSDTEVAMLKARGYHEVIKEMLTVRADHTGSKEEFYDSLRRTGKADLPESIHDPRNKTVVKLLHFMYVGAGLYTDLIETGVERELYKQSNDIANMDTNVLFSEVLSKENLDIINPEVFLSKDSLIFKNNENIFDNILDILSKKALANDVTYDTILTYDKIKRNEDILPYLLVRTSIFDKENEDAYMRLMILNQYIISIEIDKDTNTINRLYIIFEIIIDENDTKDGYLEYYAIYEK